jgi:hexosaminidase
MKKRMQLVTVLLLLLGTFHTYGQSSINDSGAMPKQNAEIDVMPYPQTLQTGSGKLRITSQFVISLSGAAKDGTLEAATNRLLKRLNKRTLVYFEPESVALNQLNGNATLTIQVKEKAAPSTGADESYKLSIDATKASLISNNTIGALRGMETLLQLVNADSAGYYFPEVQISDAPRFRWRGMMVDVARHFLPMDVLKRNIDAMAVVKLNVLHLHLSDDEGFRVESKVFPKLHQLGSKGQYYTQTELKDLINYAAARGITVYPEFDLPGHSTSWFAGYPELASAPGPYKPTHRYSIKPGTPNSEAVKIIFQSATPTLNPTKEAVYQFLDKFIAEMTTIFPSPYLHIGADENNGAAWKNNTQIVQFMNEKGIKDVQELQAYFVKRMHTILKKHGRTTVAWEEAYNATLPKDVIVQVWGALGSKHPPAMEIAEKGNPVLVSKGFYLDYFYPAYFHYTNPNIPATSNSNLLGGEAALWAELVDENTFEGRAWPRTAAIAERLWSPESVKDVDDMYRRLFTLSSQLEAEGLNHQLNTQRMLSALANGQYSHDALLVLQTLAPARGPGRLMASFTAPEQTKFQSVPLVDLPDLASADSKEAWQFRREVAAYLTTKDAGKKEKVVRQLTEWREAALQIPSLVKTAPNLKTLEAYSAKLVQAIDIGLQVLEKGTDEQKKAALLQTIKGLKSSRGDKLEILILPEIESLVTGTLVPLPKSFSPF